MDGRFLDIQETGSAHCILSRATRMPYPYHLTLHRPGLFEPRVYSPSLRIQAID